MTTDWYVVKEVGNGYSVLNTYNGLHHSWYKRKKEAERVANSFNKLAALIYREKAKVS